MIDLECQKHNFKDHVATLEDYGPIKILNFKRPQSNEFRIRFLFDEDYYTLHISGDLGHLTARNYNNMTYEGFSDFLRVIDIDYFKSKVICSERPLIEYDEELAQATLRERLIVLKHNLVDVSQAHGYADPDVEDLIYDIMEDFTEENGIGSRAYAILAEADSHAYSYASILGRQSSGVAELYLMAFGLARQQLLGQRLEEA